ncbi:capsular polysaccharide export protein, LipB/KpsS family [Acinetobacter baumannii]|uniref:capsular polysaccharide export protein, LipB/KpsS family n=1 Tax=Acinetobacter baumannii TaxID=470 RepID=UPI001EE85C1B|nr:capsular biosynthesis protein [Acinetobacter baumannii]MCG5908262.1 capsular biosynthesis protein [Acinetobacter baumannii]MCT9177270.1 capsular biosynthesis protein [Acinetobacter baumannii]
MNFLILINAAPNYKYFYYKLGLELEQRGHKVYYAIDSQRSKYLEPLPELDNSENSFFFDSYLDKNFDKNIDISQSEKQSYWGDYFYSDYDRFLTHDFNLDKDKNYWLNVKVNLDCFFEGILKEKCIDYILYENISNSFAYAAYTQIRKIGKHYIGLMGARLPNCFEIQNSIIDRELDILEELRQYPPSTEELEWFEKYKQSIVTIQPDYMRQNGLDNIAISRLLKFNKIIKAWRLFTIGFKYNYYYDYQFGNPFMAPLKAVRVNIKRYINTKRSQKFYIQNDELIKLSLKEKFYVYPIHFHPESSTSVLAPEYTCEYTNIINIANNLPFGTYLYVKDHKSAKGVQDFSFYKKISSLPNVRLINYDVNIKELIKKSQGVITVNSTAGYEALLLNKPVYLLGRVFYESFKNVYKINFKDIRSIKLLNNEDNLIDFVAYNRYCYKGKLDISDLSQNNISNVVDNIFSSIDRLND